MDNVFHGHTPLFWPRTGSAVSSLHRSAAPASLESGPLRALDALSNASISQPRLKWPGPVGKGIVGRRCMRNAGLAPLAAPVAKLPPHNSGRSQGCPGTKEWPEPAETDSSSRAVNLKPTRLSPEIQIAPTNLLEPGSPSVSRVP